MKNIEFLFPTSNEKRTLIDKKLYLETRIIELINIGEFYLTGVMLQPERDLVSEIIFGLDIDPDKKILMPGWNTDPLIRNMRVKLEAIKWSFNEETKEWKYERDQKGKIEFRDGFKSSNVVGLASGHKMMLGNSTTRRVQVDNIVNLGGPVIDADLQTAWRALNKIGLYVADAPMRSEAQAKIWKAREIPPDELKVKK